MKKSLILAYGLIPVIGIFFSLWVLVDIKISAIISLINLMFLGHILYEDKIDKEILIAIFFALFVTLYFSYEYTNANYFIGTINLFPLISWTAGLVFAREVYKLLPIGNRSMKLYLFVLIYLVVLFSFEYIGYYIFQIRLNSNYPSLLGLGILHGPIGMKAFYLSAGPLYILTSDYILNFRKRRKG